MGGVEINYMILAVCFAIIVHSVWRHARAVDRLTKGRPRLSQVRTAILGALDNKSELYGRELRERVGAAGHKMGRAQFYLTMQWMEDAGLVIGWSGEGVRGERKYRIAPAGSAILNRVKCDAAE